MKPRYTRMPQGRQGPALALAGGRRPVLSDPKRGIVTCLSSHGRVLCAALNQRMARGEWLTATRIR
jgi:hypothetical protein